MAPGTEAGLSLRAAPPMMCPSPLSPSAASLMSLTWTFMKEIGNKIQLRGDISQPELKTELNWEKVT